MQLKLPMIDVRTKQTTWATPGAITPAARRSLSSSLALALFLSANLVIRTKAISLVAAMKTRQRYGTNRKDLGATYIMF